MKYLTLPDGQRYEWKELRRLRREQIAEARPTAQPLPFDDLKVEIARPQAERSASGRYSEPTLFTTIKG